MAFYSVNLESQEAALTLLAKATKRATLSPIIRETAAIITNGCDARDDLCELNAVFLAVKEGHPKVRGMEKGVRYMSDPIAADYFIGAAELLRRCMRGACAEDCDSQSGLIAALAGALGFRVGLRAYKRSGEKQYSHVYAVALLPKLKTPGVEDKVVGMDSTVPSSSLGWEPPNGKVLTAWIQKV